MAIEFGKSYKNFFLKTIHLKSVHFDTNKLKLGVACEHQAEKSSIYIYDVFRPNNGYGLSY